LLMQLDFGSFLGSRYFISVYTTYRKLLASYDCVQHLGFISLLG